MSLRVAFDLDGTLADMRSALKMVERRLFGTDAIDPGAPDNTKGHEPPDVRSEDGEAGGVKTPDPPPKKEGLTLSQQRQVWEAVAGTKDFWESLDEIEPGTVRAIANQVVHRGWEVIFLTKRPATAGRTVQVQTQRWLRAKGYSLPSVFVVAGCRADASQGPAVER